MSHDSGNSATPRILPSKRDQPTEIDTDSPPGHGTPADDTASIASWIRNYRVENGRTYHAYRDGVYWGPNDELAKEHNDLAHALFTKTFEGKLFLAPLSKDISHVLDIGTGTGIWAIDVADEFPAAVVIGTDLSPIQPNLVPTNLRFEIDDAEGEWTFGANHFDYIHIRSLYGSITDWPKLYEQCMGALKPGGYLEQAEYSNGFDSEDGTIVPGSPITEWNRLGPECYAKLNRPKGELGILDTMYQHFIDAGFEHVEERKFRWPLGTWPKDKKLKELGVWARCHIDMGAEGWTMRLLTTCLRWSPAEVYVLCAGVRNQIRDRHVHAIHRMNVVYGRKPMT